MSKTIPKVKCLSEFVRRVDRLRGEFGRQPHHELWFRGESFSYREECRETFLRPKLYRPRIRRDGVYAPLRSVNDLLQIESDLYDSFRHGAVQLSAEKAEDENWEWDSYLLMQHHSAPTRLLDWSDGSLIALHFAVYTKTECVGSSDAVVYVLDPDKLKDMPNSDLVEKSWKAFVKKHPSEGHSEYEWEYAYLPIDNKQRAKMDMPHVPDDPLVLEFPHITRRVAAQRSRFVVFGRKAMWLASKFGKPGSPISEIIVDGDARDVIKRQLRDCGITESTIFPDLDGLGRELEHLWEIRK